jgi:hypothetical protein
MTHIATLLLYFDYHFNNVYDVNIVNETSR